MAFEFIRAKDRWSSSYRYFQTDIEPVNISSNPFVIPKTGYNNPYSYSQGSYYQAGCYGGWNSGKYITLFAIFDTEPVVTQATMGHDMNLDNALFFDDRINKWILLGTMDWDLSNSYTDQNVAVTSQLGDGFFNQRYNGNALADYYAYIQTAAPPTYNWQSVPSISGKNGILLLSTIQSVYLNNGDPVNNALESYIDFIDDSKVAVLVGEQIDDLTKVTIKYIVPVGTYEYIKLVYKVGSAPMSVTDGTAVDILQTSKSALISGIADGNTYFFKIFTDSTESEPYEFTTVRPEGDNLFVVDFNSDGRDTMRYNASKTIHVQIPSAYGIYDVDYYAAQGALADPSSPSNPTYTISNGEVTTANDHQYLCWAYDVTANQKIIPANCTLWFEFDAYFLNSEGYLDWRMYDNQGVEKIYWCWDTKYAFSANQWYNCKLEATIVNGIIPYAKYYVDNNMVEQSTENDHMLCIDEDNPIPLYFITFQTTKPTKLKNMKIYWE